MNLPTHATESIRFLKYIIADIYDSFDGQSIGKQFDSLVQKVVTRMQRRGIFSGHDSDYAELARRMQPRKAISTDFYGVPLFQRPFFTSLFNNLAVDEERVDYLAPILKSPNVSLIASLNYDLAIEMCAKRQGRGIDYGLDRWEQQKLVSWRGNEDIKFLKLHGSMNWTGTSEDITVRSDEIKAHENRVMIFGGISNKLSADGPFLQFLGKLENGLNDADTIVIVGYSFRDAHINALLRRRRMTKRKTKMIVIDPTPPKLRQIGFQTGEIPRERGGRKYTYTLDLSIIEKGAKVGLEEFF